MDGISWRNEVTGTSNGSTNFAERCIVTEARYDRAVRCGCYKAILFGEGSVTFRNGVNWGLDVTTNRNEGALYYLCDQNGHYISSSVATDTGLPNPETNNLKASGKLKKQEYNALKNLLKTCHNAKTDPNGNQLYNECSKDLRRMLRGFSDKRATS